MRVIRRSLAGQFERLLGSLIVVGFFLLLPAQAAEIELLSVDRKDGRVHIKAEILIAAPRPGVFFALSDYNRFSELSDRYVESHFVEPADDGTPRIYTEVEGCVLFFCRNVKRHARLELDNNTRIVALAEPGNSDLEYGREEWQLESIPAGTRIRYTHAMDPDFWVPPVIGVWAIRRVLSRDALSAARRLEKIALRVDGTGG
jgi:hypothetical protein